MLQIFALRFAHLHVNHPSRADLGERKLAASHPPRRETLHTKTSAIEIRISSECRSFTTRGAIDRSPCLRALLAAGICMGQEIKSVVSITGNGGEHQSDSGIVTCIWVNPLDITYQDPVS